MIETIDGDLVMRGRVISVEIHADIAAGRTEQFDSGEAFVAALDGELEPLDA